MLYVPKRACAQIGEAGAALLLGLVVGLLLMAAGLSSTLKSYLTFKSSLFLYILLPAIMFDGGYCLDPKP